MAVFMSSPFPFRCETFVTIHAKVLWKQFMRKMYMFVEFMLIVEGNLTHQTYLWTRRAQMKLLVKHVSEINDNKINGTRAQALQSIFGWLISEQSGIRF